MSLSDIERCKECKHARHMHLFHGYGRPFGRCDKTMSGDGYETCPCPRFQPRTREEIREAMGLPNVES